MTSTFRDDILNEEIREEDFPYHRSQLLEHSFDCIILHPRKGKTWMSNQNSYLYGFLHDHPLFQKEYILTNHSGIHRSPLKMAQYYHFEQQLLEEYSKHESYADIQFLETDSHPPYSCHMAGFLSQLNDDLRQQIHQVFIGYQDYLRRMTDGPRAKKVTFTYLRTECKFKTNGVDETSVLCVRRQQQSGAKFSPEKRATRRRLFGSSALQKKMTSCTNYTVKLTKAGVRWKQWIQADVNIQALFLHQYHLIVEIQKEISYNYGVCSYREDWEKVFTTTCHEGHCGPCQDYKRCRKCSIRLAQGAIVVWAAQGVGDANILPYLGSLFRSPKYGSFGVDEWANVDIEELATLLKPCSGQGLKACYINGFFEYMSEHSISLTLGNFTCFFGMQKKSACLLLSTVCSQPFGIPVDRHLKKAFHNLGWVYQGCSDATEMSDLVELWVPLEETAEMNNALAGIRQLVQSDPELMSRVEGRLGPEHKAVYKKLVQDLLK